MDKHTELVRSFLLAYPNLAHVVVCDSFSTHHSLVTTVHNSRLRLADYGEISEGEVLFLEGLSSVRDVPLSSKIAFSYTGDVSDAKKPDQGSWTLDVVRSYPHRSGLCLGGECFNSLNEPLPPFRHIKKTGHHWLASVDHDLRVMDVVVLQWSPQAMRWTAPGYWGTGTYYPTSWYKYISHVEDVDLPETRTWKLV